MAGYVVIIHVPWGGPKTGDAGGTDVPTAILITAEVEGKRMLGWRTKGWADGVSRTYLADGRVLEGTVPDLRGTIGRASEAKQGDYEWNPPTPLFNSIRTLLTSSTVPVDVTQWKTALEWELSDLTAEFTYVDCRLTRLVEASQATN